MEVLTHCDLKSLSSMIIKSLSTFHFSTFIVYPCPADVISSQPYTYIICKVAKEKKMAKKKGYIN